MLVPTGSPTTFLKLRIGWEVSKVKYTDRKSFVRLGDVLLIKASIDKKHLGIN